jgi:hypothetical protein
VVTGVVLAQREDAVQTVPPRFSPNRFVGTLADRVFVTRAAPASRTLALALALRDSGTPAVGQHGALLENETVALDAQFHLLPYRRTGPCRSWKAPALRSLVQRGGLGVSALISACTCC